MKRSSRRHEVLDRKVLQHLLLATAPLAPAPEEAAAIKQRVMGTVRRDGATGGDNYVTVRSDAGAWMEPLPRVQVKVLHPTAATIPYCCGWNQAPPCPRIFTTTTRNAWSSRAKRTWAMSG